MRKSSTIFRCVSAVGLLAVTPTLPSAIAQVAAGTTVPGTLFSVLDAGPNNLEGADIFELGGGLSPVAGGSGMNLADVSDDINAFSQSLSGNGEFLFCFSVNANSLGGPAPIDFALSPFNLPFIPTFNVTNQAANNQQAGDAFLSTEVFDRVSMLPDTLNGGPSLGLMNNVLVINQSAGGAYGPGFNLGLPVNGQMIGPDVLVPSGSKIDDLDGGAGTPPPINDFPSLFFSLTPGSPSLPTLPRTQGGSAGGSLNSPADIFIDLAPSTAGNNDISIFAEASQLGLITGNTGDNIDAVAVFDDNGDGVFNGTDQVLFSLENGSPTLGLLGEDGATIFSVTAGELPSPTPSVFARGEDFGVPGETNEVNMFTLVPNNINALTTIASKIPPPSIATVMLIGAGASFVRRRRAP